MKKLNRQVTTKMYRVALICLVISTTISVSSCKKWLEIPPSGDKIIERTVFSTDATAIGVLNGIYSSVSTSDLFQGVRSISLYAGLSGDELDLYNGVTDLKHISYYGNKLAANISFEAGSEHWTLLYPFVYRCNAAIEGLNDSDGLNPVVKQQLLGEAKFLRAFFYFYLVNLFGDIPLPTTTDSKENSLLSKEPTAAVYQLIIEDLKIAKEYLSDNYLNETLLGSSIERVRPIRWAASALLARSYLYTEDYAKAEQEATLVINNANLYNLASLNEVFLKNSTEAIWQIQPTTLGMNTKEGQTLIIPETGPSDVIAYPSNPVYLSEFLLGSFELNDQRAIPGNWIKSTVYPVNDTIQDTVTYAFKYKISSSPNVSSQAGMAEYLMMLRLGEQYLIRAEARAHLNKISEAQDDLNAIRTRSGISATSANDKSTLQVAILHERQVELFTEFGHRWFDLKRTGNLDAIMSVVTPQKSGGDPWQSYQQWYPIPFSELAKSPKLVQTPGY